MKRNLILRVKDSSFSMDKELFEVVSALEGKEFRDSTEELVLQKFKTMKDCYASFLPQTNSTNTSYRLADGGMSLDIVLEIERPTIQSMTFCEKKDGTIRVKFVVGVYEESPTDLERTTFVNWYLNNFESLIRVILCRKEGYRLIQRIEDKTYWELNGDQLEIDLTYKVIF